MSKAAIKTIETAVERDELRAWVRDLEARRELAHRVSGGLEVTLYWHADDNSTSVEIRHAPSEQTLRYIVAPERALEAFYHPFSELPLSRDVEPH
jgi:hypothetical protein